MLYLLPEIALTTQLVTRLQIYFGEKVSVFPGKRSGIIDVIPVDLVANTIILAASEALKEPPREVCAATCGFFKGCREWETDVEGLLTDDTVLEAVTKHYVFVKRGEMG